ncbi:hypothetical protein [Halobacillus litoralis]|nr:hypothetical protein [Halobacillus litoralis]
MDSSQEISLWKKKNDQYFDEIKQLISKLKQTEGWKLISYFTYAIHFSHDPKMDSMVLGSYHVHNIGDQPFPSPYICLKISSEAPFHFSGKYVYKDSLQKMKMQGAWERMNEHTDKEEFWLQPSGTAQIEPNETLSFSNFQLKWSADQKYSGSLLGYTYGEENKNGTPSLNQINISGTNIIQEGESDG